jgi:hypothetical protein
MGTAGDVAHREPWNKGKIVGQKAPFKLKDTWALRVRFQMVGRARVNASTRPRCRSASSTNAGIARRAR